MILLFCPVWSLVNHLKTESQSLWSLAKAAVARFGDREASRIAERCPPSMGRTRALTGLLRVGRVMSRFINHSCLEFPGVNGA